MDYKQQLILKIQNVNMLTNVHYPPANNTYCYGMKMF